MNSEKDKWRTGDQDQPGHRIAQPHRAELRLHHYHHRVLPSFAQRLVAIGATDHSVRSSHTAAASVVCHGIAQSLSADATSNLLSRHGVNLARLDVDALGLLFIYSQPPSSYSLSWGQSVYSWRWRPYETLKWGLTQKKQTLTGPQLLPWVIPVVTLK